MTNRKWLDSLSDDEFTDYIISVFLAGKYIGENLNNNTVINEYNLEAVDYEIWLRQEINL